MGLRRGFKTEANKYSREFRNELGLSDYAPLCPWQLAEHLAIPTLALSALSDVVPDAVHHLMNVDQRSFSAATIFEGAKRQIIFNDAHSDKRQASNISHEIAHAILGHPPTEPFSESGCRNFNKDMEDEANWLGPALLVSEEAALHIVRRGMDESTAAQSYGCTLSVMQLRLRMTAAYKRVGKQRA